MNLFFIFLFFRFITRENIIAKIKGFDHALAIIGGMMSFDDIAKLKSEWALMKTGEDYDALKEKITKILKEGFKEETISVIYEDSKRLKNRDSNDIVRH